jgi:1-acyl-sn-glycerol-3-phosphate acyltransferase
MEVKGLENVDPRGVYVFTSNHLSTYDILAVLRLQPARRVRFIAKKSLFYIPFFGWAIALAGYIAIDRGNRKRAMDSMQVALRRIQRGTSVVVYPEGTRSPDGSLLPFKTGSFLMAIRARVPVVPVTMVGTHRLQPKGRFLAVPGTFRIIFDAPIPTASLQERDRATLAAQVREIIARRLAAEGQLTEEDLARTLAGPATINAPLPAESAAR